MSDEWDADSGIVEANDGAEALAQAAAEHPQLIISDIVMPTMDGYEFVRQLRAGVCANIPVVFYTAAYHEHEARQLAKACGVIDVLNEALGTGSHPGSGQCRIEFLVQSACGNATRGLRSGAFAAGQVQELEAANVRLNALIQIGRQLASESDP